VRSSAARKQRKLARNAAKAVVLRRYYRCPRPRCNHYWTGKKTSEPKQCPKYPKYPSPAHHLLWRSPRGGLNYYDKSNWEYGGSPHDDLAERYCFDVEIKMALTFGAYQQ